MDINLNDIKSAADFENKLNQIAEAFDGNFVIKTRGNDTLSVQKSSFFGRIWQWLQGRSAQQRKVDDLISGFLLQNKDRFCDVLKKSENSSVRRYSKFIKKEMLDRIEDKSIEIKSKTNSFKVNALFFSQFPYFSNTTREKMKNQDLIPLDDFSDQVIEHLIESFNGLKNLESLPLDKWAEFYALTDYIGMTSLQDEVMLQFTQGLSGSESEAFIPPFVELLTRISEPDRHISKLTESLDRQSSAYLKAFFEAINNLESEDKEERVISFLLARAYDKGLGVKQDYSKAFEGYKKSVDQGLSKAQYELGFLYEKGWGVEQDYAKAFEYYKKAADQGDVEAQDALGRLYFLGRGVEQDYLKAFEWHKKALDVKQDYSKAFEWSKKAADQGVADAQFILGLLYEDGIEEPMFGGSGKAFEWYKKAADQGLSKAQYKLGVFYEKGRGITQDYAKAFEWYEKAADQGLSKAQYKLGVFYEKGRGITQDYAKAFEWYEKAADQGDAQAQGSLGSMYFYGDGVRQDYAKAFEWLKKAADQGDAQAQDALGVLYYHGKGVEQDFSKAFEWFKKAADQGITTAQFNLGAMYDKGDALKQDVSKAFEWYEKAAEGGLSEAQFNIGLMYNNGEGVKKDYAKAFEWCAKAARKGDAEAIKFCKARGISYT